VISCLVRNIGVELLVAERIIGHALPGLPRVYDQGTHRPQKRDALEPWTPALVALVEPPPTSPGKVVPMRTGKRR
jgi:hypothetical protein